MIFIALTFVAALLIEGLGTLVSVIGLSSLFGSNPIIIALAVALDLGKLVVVALLYKYWRTLNGLMKTYGLIAACVTMIITSAGAAGYLSGEFQKAMVGTQEVSLKVDLLKEEQARLQKRKEQIDQQIASLPEKFSASQRIRMINQFKAEQATVTTRLAEIDKELPTLKVGQINVEAKAGPILSIAKAFDITVEEASKWVILMIIFVFDPLAVFLIIAGNFLLEQKRKKSEPQAEVEKPVDEPLFTELKPTVVGLPDSKPYDPTDVVEDFIFPAPSRTTGSRVETLPVEDDKDDVMYSREPRDPIITGLKPIDPAEPVITKALIDQGVTGEEKAAVLSSVPVSFREPEPVKELIELEPKREEITYSALTGVKADPYTQIAEPQNTQQEVGYGTGVFTTGSRTK